MKHSINAFETIKLEVIIDDEGNKCKMTYRPTATDNVLGILSYKSYNSSPYKSYNPNVPSIPIRKTLVIQNETTFSITGIKKENVYEITYKILSANTDKIEFEEIEN